MSLYSKEGVTQGDTLSMLYLCHRHPSPYQYTWSSMPGSHVWYADDASALTYLP